MVTFSDQLAGIARDVFPEDRMKKFIMLLGVFMILGSMPLVQVEADEKPRCFDASRRFTEDAQNIRLIALKMGWVVGKATSLSLATIIEGKVNLYPKDAVEVCIREGEQGLEIRIQAHSKDAGKAEWGKLSAQRKKKERDNKTQKPGDEEKNKLDGERTTSI